MPLFHITNAQEDGRVYTVNLGLVHVMKLKLTLKKLTDIT